MKRINLILAVCILSVLGGCEDDRESFTSVTDLRCEYLVDPLGIDVVEPRLSWIIESNVRGQKQSAYQVLAASSEEKLAANQGDLWDSKKVETDQSIHVVYGGKALQSETRCYWKVRVWDKDGKATEWSKAAKWTMGLLNEADWQAKWIGLDGGLIKDDGKNPIADSYWIWFPQGEPAKSPPPGQMYFRRKITIPQNAVIAQAIAYVAADNYGDVFVNGKKAGSSHSFKQTVNLDITEQLKTGDNVIAVNVTNGGTTNNPAGLLAAIIVEFENTEPLKILSNRQWKASKEKPTNWTQPGFNDENWSAAAELGKLGMEPWGEIIPKAAARKLSARMLRKDLTINKKIKHATAYVCGLGLYEFYINGEKVGDRVLDPALTEYNKRFFYVTFEVGDMLKQGGNTIGVILGNGRYFAPRLVVPIESTTYGYPKLLIQMQIEYEDGSMQLITSDASWKLTVGGPITANNEYDGEDYDARKEINGWCEPGFDDSAWRKVQLVKGPAGRPAAQMIEPIRVIETIKPVKITNPKPDVYIFDMGQNMVGWCRLKVKGPRGVEVTLRHAEALDDKGLLYVDNLRSAKATGRYILKGVGAEIYEPRFTYYGFRYVEITGFPGKPDLTTLEGRVVHDDMERCGTFSCSNPLINQIYKNILWGVKGNYRSIPTDCPQRDERQGWLGDRSVESKGESYFFDIVKLYRKWLSDIKDAQKENGSVPNVAPTYWSIYTDNVTWPGSFIVIPGALYQQYGEMNILRENYPAMKKWINYMAAKYLKDNVLTKDADTYGDWCCPPESPELIHSKDPSRVTDKSLIATSYYYHLLNLMAEYAQILGKNDDIPEYTSLAGKMKTAFNKKFFNKQKSQYDNGSQTSSVLPLAFGLVPEEYKQKVFDKLVEDITVKTKGHIGTGLIGAQWLMRVLTDNGRADVAYTIASQKDYPSWGYMIEKGATTIWELWNGDTANPAMNSRNHVMLVGDLAIWMHEYLAGIRPAASGFKKIDIKPVIVGDLKYVKGCLKSPYGRLVSDWKIEGERFELNVVIPANTTAMVYVPAEKVEDVTESGKAAVKSKDLKFLRMEDGKAVFSAGSGEYKFFSKLPKS